jgi:hypothetical protein
LPEGLYQGATNTHINVDWKAFSKVLPIVQTYLPQYFKARQAQNNTDIDGNPLVKIGIWG